jgi:hypothetical protein
MNDISLRKGRAVPHCAAAEPQSTILTRPQYIRTEERERPGWFRDAQHRGSTNTEPRRHSIECLYHAIRIILLTGLGYASYKTA